MPWCPHHPDCRIIVGSQKRNLQDACCIDIKTKAEEEEQGSSETCIVGGGKKIKWLYKLQRSNTGRKTDLKSNNARYSAT